MRPHLDEYFMNIAVIVSTRSTCLRRAVGCVLIDCHGHILSTGYNGVVAGQKHCNEGSRLMRVSLDVEHVYPYACKGAHSRSGENLDMCEAVHAEQNALLQCKDIYSIDTAYCTTAPCIVCTKLLLNTSCRRIVFLEDYPQSTVCREICEKNSIKYLQYGKYNV